MKWNEKLKKSGIYDIFRHLTDGNVDLGANRIHTLGIDHDRTFSYACILRRFPAHSTSPFPRTHLFCTYP